MHGWKLGLAILLLGLAPAHAAGRWATLEAIHQLENPYDLARPGPRGELGAYQFLPETWIMHTSTPFARALDRRESDAVAIKHYEWLCRRLASRGLSPTPYNIAVAWNGGVGATTKGRAAPETIAYARRAELLAEDLERRAHASR
jgi:hypothetical protein